MYASTFYFLKRKDEEVARFVYGYGLDVKDFDHKELSVCSVNGTPKGWKLLKISGFIPKRKNY